MFIKELLSERNRHVRSENFLDVTEAAAVMLEIELNHPLPVLKAWDAEKQLYYTRAYCLIRLHSQPLGIIPLYFREDEILPAAYAPLIWNTLGQKILDHLKQDGLPAPQELPLVGLSTPASPLCMIKRKQFLAAAPFASVIVSTRDRPEDLKNCLDALLRLHYPNYEIIIVDNAPATSATWQLIQDSYQHMANLRYVREEKPGLSFARNRGIAEARGDILAFTDDDVVVDSLWLAECALAFAQSAEVVCVTGFTLPLELVTPAQFWFEDVNKFENGEVNQSFLPRLFGKESQHLHLYKGYVCGHGANMAGRADFLRSLGGFDLALGAGTPAKAGEDIAFFLHVIARKRKIAYTPSMLIYHLHRRTYPELRKQIYGYGTGFIAYLLHMLRRYPSLWPDLFSRTPVSIVQTVLSRTRRRPPVFPLPTDLRRVKFKGARLGPFAYLKSLSYVRQIQKLHAQSG